MTLQAAGQDRGFTKIVHHGGRNFLASQTMAAIFDAHARDVIARKEAELVPLLHSDGVDLLLIGPETVFAIVNIDVGPGDHQATRARTTTARPNRPQSAASG